MRGRALVERLIEKGYGVRALVRKTSDLSHLKTTGAERVFGDVEDYESLPPAVDGVGIVFHAAAKVTPGWGTWEEFERSTVKGTRNLLEASFRAKVPGEARRIGMRHWWIFVALAFGIAFAFAFPLFLFLRERRLRDPRTPAH